MSLAHATALTSNLTKAKDIFAKAMAATLSGVSASQITITKIFVNGQEVARRLSSNSSNSTNSSSTDATVKVEWSITSTAAVVQSSLITGDTLKNAIVAEAANAGVTIVITGEIAATAAVQSATTTGAAKGATSGCIEWNVRTSLASVLLAFFTLA